MAEVAPAFVGQFGPNINVRNFKAALEELGFSETYEVALGADIGAIAEAHHYVVLKKSSSLQDVPCSQRTPKTFFLIGLLRMAAYIHPPLSLKKAYSVIYHNSLRL